MRYNSPIVIRNPVYTAWMNMRARCNTPSSSSYRYYGGRGIRVCTRWNSFEKFYADMGPRPSAEHSLDRIDVNGNYEPGNCRWATREVQARNKRRPTNCSKKGHDLSAAGAVFLRNGVRKCCRCWRDNQERRRKSKAAQRMKRRAARVQGRQPRT